MNRVSAKRVSAEICICVSSGHSIFFCTRPPKSLQSSESQCLQTCCLVPVLRFSLLPPLLASFPESSRRLDSYLPLPVLCPFLTVRMIARDLTNTVWVCFSKLGMALVAKEGDLSYLFLLKS